MASLERRAVGGFDISNARSISELESMSEEERTQILLPIESLFDELERVCLPEFYEKLSRNGCEIYQKKIKTDYPTNTRVRMCSKNGEFYALGEVREYDGGSAIKAIKQFDV